MTNPHPGCMDRRDGSVVTTLIRAASVAMLFSAFLSASPSADPTNEIAKPIVIRHFSRRYQATAYINVFSLNLFSRSDVGFATATVDDESGAQRRQIRLEFLSGSVPERAHGLNRFGFIREQVLEDNARFERATYFGLITANREQSLSQAKEALNQNSGPTMPFVAARAEMDRFHVQYSVRHMDLPSQIRATSADDLLARVKGSFAQPEIGEPEHDIALNGTSLSTFLYALRAVMADPALKPQKRFLYNGKTYMLEVEKRVDAKAAEEFVAAHLAESGSSIVSLTGSIRNEDSGQSTPFRLWYDRSGQDLLPVRFEFRPKSYLKLVFQSVPEQTQAGTSLASRAPLAR